MTEDKSEETEVDYFPQLMVRLKVQEFRYGTNELTGEKTVTTKDQPIYMKSVVVSREMLEKGRSKVLSDYLSDILTKVFKDIKEGKTSPPEGEEIATPSQ